MQHLTKQATKHKPTQLQPQTTTTSKINPKQKPKTTKQENKKYHIIQQQKQPSISKFQ